MSRGNTYSLPRDANRVPVVAGVSTTDGITPTPLEVDPVTGLLQTNATITGTITADVDVATDMFGQTVTSTRYNQVEIDYAGNDPDAITDITVTKTNGGDASTANGQAVYTTGANTNGGIKAVTNKTITYRPHNESYAAFTAIFTTGLANSYQRIGIYDTNNGFFIGYEGTSFGITIRSSTVDTTIPKASWNVDTLSGGASSHFTRNGVPEALNPAKDNLYRIRFGWLGASAVYFEVLSPDQEWVLFHTYRTANSGTVPSIANPNLPITIDVQKTAAGATVLTMNTACWAGGTSSNMMKVTDTITDNTLAPLQRAVITGYSSAGGGSYNNVKVTPSGSLTVAVGDITGIVGQQTMANSIPVVIASNQTAITVNNATAANLKVDLSGTAANATAIKVDGSAVTQPVSGTVTTTPSTSTTTSLTGVAVTNSAATILALNANRKGATLYNEGTIDCYVKLGSTPTTTSYTVLITVGSYYEVPFEYTGIITGITASASTATIRVTELT